VALLLQKKWVESSRNLRKVKQTMKTTFLYRALAPLASLLSVAALIPMMGQAQQAPQGYGYPPEYYQAAPEYPRYQTAPDYDEDRYEPRESRLVPPHEFFKILGKRVGRAFRDIFSGEASAPYEDEHPARGRNLDVPPPYGSYYEPQPGSPPPQGYVPAYPPRYDVTPPAYNNAAPRYEAPPVPAQGQPQAQPQTRMDPEPPQAATRTLPPPAAGSSSKPKTQSTPPKKYTPPTITRDPTTSKVDSQPPAPKKTAPATNPIKDEPPAVAKTDSGAGKPAASASSPKPAANTPGNTGAFLKGKRTAKPGRVTSPYPPYQELDVTGLSSGSLALDPTTQKVFEVP
jgi:hypothetical protein